MVSAAKSARWAGWLFPPVLVAVLLWSGRSVDPALVEPPAPSAAPGAALPRPEGWTLSGAASYPAERMYEKINGKAPYYHEYGAVSLDSGTWSDGSNRWDMLLYRFATPDGARGAFRGERPDERADVPGGYTTPGMAAASAGTAYVQLLAHRPEADPAPAADLARSLLAPFEAGDPAGKPAEISLADLAGEASAGDVKTSPRSAFGYSAFDGVEHVEVELDGRRARWYRMPGGEETLAAYRDELSLVGAEDVFDIDHGAGAQVFGSWELAAVRGGRVVGVRDAASRQDLVRHWETFEQALGEARDD
jgi:hypothetical protein